MYKRLLTSLFLAFSLIGLNACRSLYFYSDANKPFFISDTAKLGDTAPADTLNVMTFNIKKSRKIALAISEMKQLEKRNPVDIFLLQEMDEKGVEAIAGNLGLNYLYIPVSYDKADKKNIGNAILSRGTIDHPAKLILPHAKWQNRQRRELVTGEVMIHQKKILVCCVHTETVAMSRAKRMDQVDSVIRYVQQQSPRYKYMLIGGDFNTAFRGYSRSVVNGFNRIGFDWVTSRAGYTAKALMGLARPTNDYIFSKGFGVANGWVLRGSKASDHYPVLGTVRYDPETVPPSPPGVQDAASVLISSRSPQDTVPRKNFLLASGELLVAEMTPWVFDECIRNEDYTHLTWQSTKYNLSPLHWAWDNDPFTTNEFGHPYHGSLFYNSLRSNGYSFWEAVPASFAGSYLWETFSENQAPAPNDFINTGFGGITLGEMTYRLANKILDNRSRGFQRQVREISAMLLNPMNGLTRLIDGRWGRVYGNSPEHDSSNVYMELDLGGRRFSVNNHDGGLELYGHVKLIYGSPFEDYKIPFSNIYVNAEFSPDDSAKFNLVSAYGSVKGWRLNDGGKIKNLLMISMNYDYLSNAAFFYSAQSIRLNLFSAFAFSKRIQLNTMVGAGPAILAAVPDTSLYEGRNYDFCSGLSFHANLQLSVAGHLFYGINYRGGWMKTLNGNADYHLLHTITSELRWLIADGFSLCAEPGYFRLNTYYKPDLEVSRAYPYFRVSARYAVNF